ncbi:MAG TPA: DUF4158 domain-containing protein [Ktedonobacteraceae bacterium]|nr:DUF4158 domain-containing protein [Ktedonobacteraceae bacterium]
MKRQWDIEELIEHFTLVGDDLDSFANKTGPTRLGYALLLKCFQYEGRFPAAKYDIPKSVVDYVARQLKLDPAHWLWDHCQRERPCDRHFQPIWD